MSYPQDQIPQRTSLYEAIEEARINNANNQRRIGRPLGIPTQSTEAYSPYEVVGSRISEVEGGIYQPEEQILTRNVPVNNRRSKEIYVEDRVETHPTATKTERIAKDQVRSQPVTTSSVGYSGNQPVMTRVIDGSERVLTNYEDLHPVVLSSVPITGSNSSEVPLVRREQVRSTNRIIDNEQYSPMGPVTTSTRVIQPQTQVINEPVNIRREQVMRTERVIDSDQYSPISPITTTTRVIQPQTQIINEPVNNQFTRVTREEVIRESQPVSATKVQQRVVLPYVEEFETVHTVQSPHLSEIRPVGETHLRDSPRLERSTQVLKSQWESQIADLSQFRHENHVTFENWEANRSVFVSDRVNIIEDLIGGLERTLGWLDVGIEKVILFFKERESQELGYSKTVKHGLTQVGEHFESGEHPEIMNNFSRILKENDAFHAQDKRNSEILGMFIRKDILDWILIPGEKNYKEQAHVLLHPLHQQKKKLNHQATKRQRAYNKYFKLYDSVQKTGKPTDKDDSLFKRQLKYSLAAREELRMLRLYNQQGLTVIEEFETLAPMRLDEVQKAYSMYLQKYSELYKSNVSTPDPLIQMLGQSNGPDSLQMFFSVRNMLSPGNYQFLVQKLGIYGREVNFADLNSYLINFPDSIDPAKSSFVMREWNAIRQGNLIKKSKACRVIAAANNNIIIVTKKDEQSETGRVRNPLQMRFTRVEEVGSLEDGTVVKVVERVPGTLFTHKHKTNLKFETVEEAQQFMQYVNGQNVTEV